MSITKTGLALSNREIATFIVFAIRHFRHEVNWVELTFPKNFDCYQKKKREKRKLANSSADQRDFSNDRRQKCGTHFGSSFLFVSKVANGITGCCAGILCIVQI